MGMTPPNNSRDVLTWTADENGNTAWIIDFYMNDRWSNASDWDCKVLWWQELPANPILKRGE